MSKKSQRTDRDNIIIIKKEDFPKERIPIGEKKEKILSSPNTRRQNNKSNLRKQFLEDYYEELEEDIEDDFPDDA